MFQMDAREDVIQQWIDATRRFAEYRGELIQAFRWFGTACVEAMKEGHPPGGPHPADGEMPTYGENAYEDISGYLTDSIGFSLEEGPVWDPKNGPAPAFPTLLIFATAPYADAVEYGVPGHSRPYPFFFDTIALLMPELVERIDAIMRKADAIRVT